MKILVADDHSSTRIMLSARLRSWGHEVTLASDGAEALEKLGPSGSRLLLCDWMMPNLTGLEVCQRVRSADLEHYVYVILCTGRDEKSDLIAGMEAGADDFIVKPVDFDELRVALRAGSRVLELEHKLAEQNRELRTANSKLNEAYRTIEKDLQAAAALQRSMLPISADPITGVNVEHLFIPAQFLAGDIFNFFALDNARIGFYHLDVSGHGIPSALLSVSLSRELSPECGNNLLMCDRSVGGPREAVPPSEVITELNRRFQSQEGLYYTIVYGIADVASDRISLCQGGHPSPLHQTRQGTVSEIGEGGFPVGMVYPMDYETSFADFLPGERFFLYSDGITECMNTHGEAFGLARLTASLQRSRNSSLRDLVSELRSNLEDWGGSTSFEDDISMLALERAA